MKKVLLTGFEPFGGEIINPSKEIVQSLGTKTNVSIKKVILPVLWNDSQKILFDAIDEFKPNYVVLVGQAGGDNSIRIERVGLNICGCIADENRIYPNSENPKNEIKIFDNGENAYFSTFDYSAIYESIKSENIKVRMSYSAGVFMCNYVLYSVLYKSKMEKLDLKAGFIHLPYLKEQNHDCFMSFDEMKKAIEIVIDNC